MDDDLEQWRERSKAKAPSAERWKRAGWLVFWCLVAVAYFGQGSWALAWAVAGAWVALWHLSYWPRFYRDIWEPPSVLAFMLLITSVGTYFDHVQLSNTLKRLEARCEKEWHWRSGKPGHVCEDILYLSQ
jgi:hypothetical protein